VAEIYLGSDEERSFICSFLALHRETYPQELFLRNGFDNLKVFLGRNNCDTNLFSEFISYVCAHFADKFQQELCLIDQDRYYVALPEEGKIGGFFSHGSVGYSNIWHAACAVALSPDRIQNRSLIALELARSYIHDCLHHSTFCSFRLIRGRSRTINDTKRMLPTINREQYGFNFRDNAGHQYSDSSLNDRAPEAIHLNTWMDGTIVIYVARNLKAFGLDALEVKSDAERMLVAEMSLNSSSYTSNFGKRFFEEVTKPTARFVEKWGGEDLERLALGTMLTGEPTALRQYFSQVMNKHNAWQKTFRSAKFTLEVDDGSP
jgi:hypothetical protein